MRNEIAYPLPSSLMHEAEALMAEIPDREDTVFSLRRLLGRTYAVGHQDGRMAQVTESYYDRISAIQPNESVGSDE